MRHDVLTPCAQPSPLGGSCGDTPTHVYRTGVCCRYCAPGATADACEHGTAWAQRCGRCEGEPPAPSPVPSPSATREPPIYGMATTDPLGRTITVSDNGRPFDDRLPRYPCSDCGRPRARGHKGDHTP